MKPVLFPGLRRPAGMPEIRSHLNRGASLALAASVIGAVAGCSPPPSGPPTANQTAAFASQADDALKAMKACDLAAQHAIAASGTTNYDAALSAESECEKTANTLVNFRFDARIGQQFEQPLDDAVAACWSAYDAKARGIAKLAIPANPMASVDTGPAPDFRQIDSKAQACIASLDQKARALGFKAGLPAPAS